ncbi:hypothetical protein J1781_25430 [Rahnella sp. C60]|uniref:hypothetical protein n=1 Tax=Rahnella perminowiae TaxID=2816244 RepID=UPI001C26585B|nr:hypothetical protein [Rahnella perminowiae]MBU9818173.1 hypothetical protein [Rahnella perminowiae]
MTDNKKSIAQDGYQPINEGYQPKVDSATKKDFATNGYQPPKQVQQPSSPPKKP